MRNLILLIAFFCIFGLIFESCLKDKTLNPMELEENEITFRNVGIDNDFENQNFNNLAMVISQAFTDNPDFRSMVKNEAMLRFDDDYDILLRSFKDSLITVGDGTIKISKFLDDYYKKLGLHVFPYDESNNNTNNIDQLVRINPLTQISVPVRIENWTSNYNPIVTFIPKEYNETETLYVIGYQNNKPVVVDAVNEPNMPLVVIGLNERVDKPVPNDDPPSVDIIVEASTYQAGIRLTWVIDHNANPILGYHVFRKGNGSSNFDLIGNCEGIDNLVFEDNTVKKLTIYTYYVKAYNNIGYSKSSNQVTCIAPDIPNEVVTFNANHFEYDDIELRWTSKQGEFVDHYELFKRVVGVDNDYKLLGSFNSNTYYYIDNNVNHGKKTLYRFHQVNASGPSNPKYDFVVAPIRNIAQPSPVFIKFMDYYQGDLKKIEGYLRGAPEFKVSVVKAGAESGDTAIIQEYALFNFPYRILPFCYFNNRLISNWLPSNWMETYTFRVFEEDEGPIADLEINAGFDKKDSLKTKFISGQLKITIDDLFNNKDEDCGTGTLRYTDEPHDHLILFPNYGFRIGIDN